MEKDRWVALFANSVGVMVLAELLLSRWMPDWYLELVRWAVCVAAIFVARYVQGQYAELTRYSAVVLAVLFNPILRFQSSLDVWWMLSIFACFVLFSGGNILWRLWPEEKSQVEARARAAQREVERRASLTPEQRRTEDDAIQREVMEMYDSLDQ